MRISVIVPVHNGADFLNRSLQAICDAKNDETEIIVVDDGSTDAGGELASRYTDKVLRLEKKSGSACARNFGAVEADGEILFFVDADVVVGRDSIEFLENFFRGEPQYAAVFGSYDDAPAETDFFSQYRNLIHHYFHQLSPAEAETFWSGCGAVRKDVFQAVNGYNGNLYSRPSIEDIEFGYRLREEGYRIRLEKNFQAKHLKKWSFRNIIRTDIFYRALPWSRLLVENRGRRHTLNADLTQKISAGAAWLTVLSVLAAALVTREFLFASLLGLAVIFGLNWQLHKFFWRKKGPVFVVGALAMQILYYLYSSLVFAACVFEFYLWRKFRGKE